MGTISDKLMRIINTKEDIRKALISKGYDVPTSIPFKEYAKMILDLPCKVDSFPDIEGIVARYSASGLTNEQMAAEEELTKIKDYFVKTYPWLFPDQAWTVVGKTNEDEDRATIANITGNGNDLILSNSGFAEGSGYGLYAENYAGGRWVQSTDRADLTWTSYSVNITSVKVASTQLYYQSYPEQPSFIVPSYKIKVYGLKDGQTLSYRQVYKISEDGTYTLPSFPFKANGDWYGFTLNKVQESCDITIEQIPEYEGYLVTDGVDDKITSSTFEMGNVFKSLDAQADDEPQYPYPVYDSPSSELESVLSSKEWVSDVNDERL